MPTTRLNRDAFLYAKELIEESVKEGDLTEDDGKKALEKVQIEVDNGVKKVDDVIGSKEKDLMQV